MICVKILIISHEFPPVGGGGANACFYLSKGFVEVNHEVTVITTNFNLDSDSMINGVRIIRVNAKRQDKTHASFMEMYSYLKLAKKKAEELCMKERFDVCLAFFGIPAGVVAYKLKQKYNIPYIIRMGGGDVPGFQKRFKVIYKFIGIILKQIWKNAEALVANSDGLKQIALTFYDKLPIEVIYNGVDLTEFYPKEKTIKEEVRILCVSRLIERKGLQYIIPLLNYLREKATKKITFTVVGDGPYKDFLIRLARDYECLDMIDFVGHKNHDELLRYYQDADLFILPSQKEGMPNVVLEAMACGMPIIMSKVEGSRELIKDNGFVIDINNQSDIIEKLLMMINNDDLRIKCGLNSRKLAVEHFSWDRAVSSYIRLLSKACDVNA